MLRTAAFAVVCAVTAAAQGAIIGPGGAVFTPAGFAAGTLGAPVTPLQSSPFVTPSFTGTLLSQGFVGMTGNIGGVSYAYELSNNAGSATSLNRMTVNGFTGFTTDVTWISNSAPGTIAPVAADRSPFAGDVVGFFFGAFSPGFTPVTPGGTTFILVVHTNAQFSALNVASLIDGFTANVPAWAPVPTPASSALLGMGLIVAARRRRA